MIRSLVARLRGRTPPNESRPTEAKAPAPVLLELNLDEALQHESSYWRQLIGQLLLSGFLAVFSVGVLVAIPYVGLSPTATDRWLSSIDIGIETPFGLGALGILATAIVALQVSVRSTPVAPEPERRLGRQVALESVARLAGLAAFAIAIGMTIRHGVDLVNLNIFALFGPPAGALLLAAIAADAAMTSASDHGHLLDEARKKRATTRIQAIVDRRARESEPPSRRSACVQIVGAFVLIPVALGVLYCLMAGFRSLYAFGWASLFASVVIFISLGLVFVGRLFRDRGETFIWAYFYLLGMIAIALPTVFAFRSLPGLIWSDTRGLFFRVILALALGAGSLVCVHILTRTIPGSTTRGVGYQLLATLLERHLKREMARTLEPDHRSEKLALAILFPPATIVRFYIAKNHAAGGLPAEVSKRSLTAAFASLALGVSVLALLVIMNPSLPSLASS